MLKEAFKETEYILHSSYAVSISVSNYDSQFCMDLGISSLFSCLLGGVFKHVLQVTDGRMASKLRF